MHRAVTVNGMTSMGVFLIIKMLIINLSVKKTNATAKLISLPL